MTFETVIIIGVLLVGFFVITVLWDYFSKPWGRWHTHHRYQIRTFLGRHIDPRFHHVHDDEPMTCPICNRDHYRWEWSERYRAIPDFRRDYYHHYPVGNFMVLPCVDCAVTHRDQIRTAAGYD